MKRFYKYLSEIIVISQLVSACAPLNPLVGPVDSNDRSYEWPKADTHTGGLGAAINYAYDWQRAYYRAASEHSQLNANSSGALIPIGLTALFLGITSPGSRDAITAVGLGGAGLYGANSYFYSVQRERIYIAGFEAINCAITSAISVGGKDDALMTQLGMLRAAATSLQTATARYSSAVGRVAANTEAFMEINAANNQIAAAGTLDLAGQNILIQHANLPEILIAATNGIVGQVSEQLAKTEPDASAISGLLSGLTKPGALPWGGTLPQPNTPKDKQKAELPPELQATHDAMAHAQANLKLVYDATNSLIQEAVNALKGSDPASCKVKTVDSDFQIIPAAASAQLAQGATISFTAVGGDAQAAWAGPVLNKVTFVRPAGSARTIEVTAATDAQLGQTTLLITDSKGANAKSIDITVSAMASSGQPVGGAKQTDAPKLPTNSNPLNLSSVEIERMQILVGLQGADVDGKLGDKTTKAVATFQTNNGLTATGIIDDKTRVKALEIAPQSMRGEPLKGGRNSYERWLLTPNNLSVVQTKLHLQTTDDLSSSANRNLLSTAITEFIAKNGEALPELATSAEGKKGNLDKTIVAAILNAP